MKKRRWNLHKLRTAENEKIQPIAYIKVYRNEVKNFNPIHLSRYKNYWFFTQRGPGGGIFIMDSYKPYNNTLTVIEQERLKKMHDKAEEEGKKILERVLRKYGAYKLEL